ncbi:MAG TPA: S16 family serine protease [Acidimicrobiales bacterium]|nr:S16 family serine protease [Acidimicrobiales bacterium]
MVSPAGPLAWDSLPREPVRRWLLFSLPFFVIFATLLSSQLPVPYYAIEPGTARQINDLIKAPRDKSYPPKGEVLLTTVSLGPVTAFQAVAGWLDPDVDVVPEERILGTGDRTQYRQAALQQIDTSKEEAVVLALRRLGHAIDEHGEGALVESVENNSAASDRLSPGDTIVAVDGTPTVLNQQARAAIAAHRPGDLITLEVVPADNSAKRTVTANLGARPETGGAFLGVSLRTRNRKFNLPFPVSIESLGIGGPSAGLAFCLAALDTLSPGELTGGRKVAVTGTISLDGTVGDVGGVAQKTAAVRRAGADLFLVPPGEFEIASARAGKHLEVVKVGTLEEAIQALGRHGGNINALGPGPAAALG